MATGNSDSDRSDDPIAAEPVFPAEPSTPHVTWLTLDDFVVSPGAPVSSHPPGPGLPEALMWLGGVIGLQFVCFTIAAVIVMAGHAIMLPPSEQQELMESLRDPNAMESLQAGLRAPMLVGSQLLFLIGTIVAVRLRLGKDTLRRLSFATIPVRHAVLIALLIFPMMVVSQHVYAWAEPVWQRLVEMLPALHGLDALNTMTAIPELTHELVLPLLLFAFAIVPAVAEELVFRGVIGRGLTARWGLVAGVLLTSMLFAAAHLHPLHVLGVLPLGIAMHFVYLATRSFWAPMTFHLLNNGLAVAVLKMQPVSADQTATAANSAQPLSFVLALASSVAIGLLMWQMRVRYVLPDGQTWDPGHESVECPPTSAPVLRSCRPATGLLAGFTAICVLALFLSTIVQAAMTP